MCVCFVRHATTTTTPLLRQHTPHTGPDPTHNHDIYIYLSIYIYITHTFSPKTKNTKSHFLPSTTRYDPNTHTLFVRVVSHTKRTTHTSLSLSPHTHTLRTVWREGGRDRRNRRLDDSSRACALASVHPPEGNDKHQPKNNNTTTQSILEPQQPTIYMNAG